MTPSVHAVQMPPMGSAFPPALGAALPLIWALIGLLSAGLVLGANAPYTAGSSAELSLTQYKSTAASGVVEQLRSRVASHQTRLEFSPSQGYLPALLRELRIPSASQLLVASKTSPNKAHISPRNPRALYYNEQVAVACVPGAELLEVAATDPKLGVVFYTLEQKPASEPKLVRDDRCLECHASPRTLDAPGWLVRSFVTDGDGEIDVLSGVVVSHRTPIESRWGGYYVTGDTGGQRHRGNIFAPAGGIKAASVAPLRGVDLLDLKPLLDIGKFIEPTSDVVALMVFEHQVHMLNLITRLRFDSEALGETASTEAIKPATEDLLRYLLFVEEAPLAAPVRGSAGFVASFQAQGVQDKSGRSLRQFDLGTRLFKYPCSYMIYSSSMEALPPRAQRHVYHRLWQILSGEDSSPAYQSLQPGARVAVREILQQTKKDLPAYWQL